MSALTNMPSTSTIFSAYTSLAASTMLIQAVANEAKSLADLFLPKQLQRSILSKLETLFGVWGGSEVTLVINQYQNMYIINEMYETIEVYLSTKITAPSLQRLTVSGHQNDKNLTVSIDKDQDVLDYFEGIQLKWKLICIVNDSTEFGRSESKSYELTFHRQFKELVLDSYLPYVLTRSKAICEENRTLKLYSSGFGGDNGEDGVWGSINLNHPTTFNTLAMETNLKKEVMEDLDMFIKRKEFYKRVGKPWKRGYLLYGPPGTGKSSLIAAMANYLNFNIYDLELANIHSNLELRKLLVATTNRSILVIEDIDCSVELKDRTAAPAQGSNDEDNVLTLSGLLNFIDGLWSSCGDERIVIFTTNYKDKLDPALLRPGRMDMHIHMSYCTPCGFKLLASNYLQIQSDPLFEEIESLIKKVNVTPAEVAEQLMKTDDVQTSLKGLINFIQKKETDQCSPSNAKEDETENGTGQKTANQKRKKSQKEPGRNENKSKRSTRNTRRWQISKMICFT